MRSLLLLIGSLLLFSPTLPACGYYIMGEQYRIALLDPYLIGNEYSAFFYSTQLLNHGQNAQAGRDRLRNAQAWATELGAGVSPQNVMDILYGTTLADWLAAKGGAAKQNGWANNPAWRAISQRPDLLEYALWAKGYEQPHKEVTYWEWEEMEEEPVADPATEAYTTNFQARAAAGYAGAPKNSFLADRYAYQLLLMAYYDGDEAAMATYFNRHFKGKQGPLADWARFHFAGQWNEEGRYLVEMANAFRAVPEKALAVYRRTDQRIDLTLALSAAKTDAERSNLYALAALKRKGKALPLLSEAYRLDPTNPVLDLLVVREFNKVEDWLMTYLLTDLGPALPSTDWPEWDVKDYEAKVAALRKSNYAKDRAYLKDLRTFIRSYRSATGPTHFNEILQAQAALLDEDYATALQLTASLPIGEATPISTQVRVIRFLALLQSGRLDQPAVKDELARHLLVLETELGPVSDDEMWDQEGNLRAGLNRAAAQAFAAVQDTVSAFFLHNRSLGLPLGEYWSSEYYNQIRYLDRNISDGVMERIIEVIKKADTTTPWGKLQLKARLPEVNALHDLAGTLALRRNDLPVALRHFAAVPDSWYANAYEFKTYLTESPLNDMWSNRPKRIAFTSKADAVKQLQQLEKVRATGGAAAAAANLTLAHAWYNMSNYGPSWMMLKYGRYLTEPEMAMPWPKGGSHPAVPHSAADFALIQQADRAAKYFAAAAAAAGDPETLAEADLGQRIITLRMAEAAEERSRNWDLTWEEYNKQNSLTYAKLMQPFVKKYRNTSVYQDAIMQCSSLAAIGN